MCHWWAGVSPLMCHWWAGVSPLMCHWWAGVSPLMCHWWAGVSPLMCHWWAGVSPLMCHWWAGVSLLMCHWWGRCIFTNVSVWAGVSSCGVCHQKSQKICTVEWWSLARRQHSMLPGRTTGSFTVTSVCLTRLTIRLNNCSKFRVYVYW